MASIYDQIDALLLKQLELYDEYRRLHEELHGRMKHGFLHLSKAKYNQGTTVISPSSFDLRMKSTRNLSVNEQGEFEWITESYTPQDASESNLRNRKSSENDHSPNESSGNMKEVSLPPRDPIYWFGGLPSFSLRNSQKEFKNVLHLVPQLASISLQMTQIEHECQELKNKL